MDQLAGGGLVAFVGGLADPVGEAIAAEACEAHQLDILGIVAVAQVAHQATEGGGGDIVGERV